MHALSRLRGGGDDGVIATHMAITVAFALFAVTQLTRTTVQAQEIDMRVTDIVGSVATIDEETAMVSVLDDTGQITTDILNTAMPLSAQTQQITEAALQIDGNVKEILGSANTINDAAQSINSTVGSINGSVVAINKTAKAINANVAGILGSFQALSPVVTSINNGVAGIDQRGDVVIELSRAIKADTGNILRPVEGVNANARAICNSTLLLGTGNCVS